jgi:hypothetical protein
VAVNAIDEFGRFLVQSVRDAAIQSCDRRLQPNADSLISRRWRDASTNSPADFVRVLIPDIVDDALFYLLQAIDQGVLRISFRAVDGTEVDLVEDGLGELSGSYAGNPGWRNMYSGERFPDDFSDLL